MSFTIATTQIMVLTQDLTGGYPPMMLPWEKRISDAGTTARIGGGVVPAHADELVIELPGITTVSTLWFCPDAAMDVFIGAGNTVATPVLAGGCVGFTAGALSATGILRVTYDGDDDTTYAIVWGGA